MELKLILLIGALLLVLSFIRVFAKRDDRDEIEVTKPASKIPNDKIVMVKGVAIEQVRQAVQQFCNLYNKQEERITIVQVSKISDAETAITFPYDIEFGRFCFFVNYMYYPNNISYKTDMKGWATTKPGDMWVSNDYAGKQVMLYIPAGNKEVDSVYLTTEENVGYKIAFGDSGEPKRMIPPAINFEPQSLGEAFNSSLDEEIS